jgi:hypothetical protein
LSFLLHFSYPYLAQLWDLSLQYSTIPHEKISERENDTLVKILLKITHWLNTQKNFQMSDFNNVFLIFDF